MNFVHVPHYDELSPENVLAKLEFGKERKTSDQKATESKIKQYCPELKYKKRPKDREFFFNVLNTIKPKFVEEAVFRAM